MEGRTQEKRSLLAWLEARMNLTEVVSFLSVFGLLPTELDTRKPLREALREAISRPLPSYARWPRILGIVAFILFLFLLVTGILLAFYYQPTAADAYGSMTSIARDVNFGTLVSQVHRWAATIFLLVLGLRVIRFFFGGLYGNGREIIWMAGVFAYVVASFADLSGRLLPWDAEGYWTTVRAREVTDRLPGLGSLLTFLIGSSTPDSLILTRVYVMHIVVFPILLLGLFYTHFSSVRRVGMSRVDVPASRRSFRIALYDMALVLIGLVGILVTLAVLFPHSFHAQADPLATPPDARPPWYLLAPHALQQILPPVVPSLLRGLFLMGIFAVVLLLPFLDRSGGHGPGRRRIVIVGIAVCALWAILTLIGWRLEVAR